MRVALLIPDGVGVRNFLLGGFLRCLSESAEVDAVHVVPDEMVELFRAGLNGRVHFHPLIPYRQTRPVLAMQYSLGYAQMYWGDTRSMRHLRNKTPKGSKSMAALVRITRLIGRAAASPGRMRVLDRWHCNAVRRLPETAHYRELFSRTRPSVVFCSHQRPSVVLPAVIAARDLKIATATFIFSWDNLTSKGRIVAPFDHYLVWSEHMRKELLKYYPDVAPGRIHVVGTPQFEPYGDKNLLWTREEFFRRAGADPGRPLICYSGGDAGTCPEDPEHVRVLMELIREGKIRGNPQVLVRPVPVDDGKRYERVRGLFPELIFAQPKWVHTRPGSWASVIPSAEDVQFLSNLTHHADLNINLGSTMTLDFAIHDRPVVNVAFDVADPPVFGMPVWDYYYQFEHYRPVIELGAARFARSRQEFAEHVNAYLEDPSLDREGRRRLVEMQVGVPLGQSNLRIREALSAIARGGA